MKWWGCIGLTDNRRMEVKRVTNDTREAYIYSVWLM